MSATQKGTNIQTLVFEPLTLWFDDTFSQTLCILSIHQTIASLRQFCYIALMSFFPSVTIWRWLPTTERVINRGGARMRQTLMAPANFIFNPPQQSFPEKENIINFYSGCWSIFAKDSFGCSSNKLAAIMLTEESLWLWRSILCFTFRTNAPAAT